MGKIIHPRYFPFCYGPGRTLSPSYQGIQNAGYWTGLQTSLANAMGLYWRVRNYHVSGRLYDQLGFADKPPYSSFEFDVRSTAGSEEELVCYRGFELVNFTTDPPGEENDDVWFDLFPSKILNADPVEIGPDFIPVYGTGTLVSIYLNILVDWIGSEANKVNTLGPPSYGAILETRNIQAFGQSIPFPVYLTSWVQGSGAPEYAEFEDVIATEYWSYGGTYDTATGLPL